VGVKKSKAISLMARFYDIDLDHTVTMGDGYNDLSMFRVSGISVAMKNSNQNVKAKALYETKFSNKEGGVGHYINKLLDNIGEQLVKAKKDRKEKFIISDKTA
jgi:hydroxymethylpyrimidine pyrophosphatase-like HAD family hydrolase